FQVNNYGNGGIGGDDVRALAQSGAGNCNANFSTPTDGGRGRMRMYNCNIATPRRNGDIDAVVITHEFGHGISIRQVGGPGNSGCLSNVQQPGEGWSDWLGLVYTATASDAATDGRGIATWLFGQTATGVGIRGQRYSTDPAINTWTYSSIAGMGIPHGVGSVWAQGIWEVYWALVGQHGFDGDLYDAAGGSGNQRALFYINEGFKNTACSPTFLDTRDGIIQAAIDNNGGQDVCLIWNAFAGFGLGEDATTAGNNTTTATDGFAVPVMCDLSTIFTDGFEPGNVSAWSGSLP
ncbi:MAG: M36 family metallopeptidase, partial [Acidobacteria bacterium]|nr:M36 family metallopeptidase [Acidobacteriota bacterium]